MAVSLLTISTLSVVALCICLLVRRGLKGPLHSFIHMDGSSIISSINNRISGVSSDSNSGSLIRSIIQEERSQRTLRSARNLASNSNSPSIDLINPNLDIESATKQLGDLLSLIHNRYELDTSIGQQFMNTANNMGENTWDILKYKFAYKMLSKNATFHMIFGGSSVTAGHDNYYNQSYPYVFKKRMNSIMKALGIELIVRNIAQGANNCIPYNLCLESMGGRDPDFVGWEQSYNCGHADDVFELVGRVAGYSKNFGTAYFSASGAWAPSKCAKSTEPIPYSSEDWNDIAAGLPKWEPSKSQLQVIKMKMNEYNKAKPSSDRFSKAWEKPGNYHIGVHGFNVWEQNALCKTIDKDGKTEKNNCNGIDAAQSMNENCKMKFMTEEASYYGSDNGKGANWHPTRAFHMLRGEFIAYLYSLAMLDAVQMLQADLRAKDVNADSLAKRYYDKLREIHPKIPSTSKRCSTYHCERRPVCFTNYLPHYGEGMRLTDIIVGQTNWTHDQEVNGTYVGMYGEWSQHYGYLDAKPAYSAKADQGDIYLRINIASSSADYFLLCGASKESMLHAHVFIDLNANSDPSKLKDYHPSNKRIEWSKRKIIGNECEYIFDVPKGSHIITITPNTTHASHTTSLSHVIMYE